MNKRIWCFLIAVVFISSILGFASDNEKIVFFNGAPLLKISEGGIEHMVEDINKEAALEYKCTITKIGDRYF